MDATHFHLVFTHAVVWLLIAGTLVLGWSLLRKSLDGRNIALSMILAGALLAIPVYLTGEEAEHEVEEYGVSHEVIHEHEEAAELAFIFIEIFGLAALMALLLGMRRNETSLLPSTIVLILGLVVCFMSIRVANLGGEIRHVEIREGASPEGSVGHDDGDHGEEHGDDHDGEDDGDEFAPTPEEWE